MSKKISVLLMIMTLLLMTACSSSKVESPVKVDEPTSVESTATQNSEATTAPPETVETTEMTEMTETTESSDLQEPYIWNDFELKKLDDSTVQLYDFKGKIIVINFWATWCGYCEEEMPLIEALSQNDKYHVLAIDVGEDAQTINKYLEEQGLTLDVYLDEDQSLLSQFGVTGFPTTVFLGPDFEYLYTYPGMLDQKTLDAILESIDHYLSQ